MGQFSEELRFDTTRAIKWSASNKLSINFDKFSILDFSYKNTYDSSAVLFSINIAIQNEKTN